MLTNELTFVPASQCSKLPELNFDSKGGSRGRHGAVLLLPPDIRVDIPTLRRSAQRFLLAAALAGLAFAYPNSYAGGEEAPPGYVGESGSELDETPALPPAVGTQSATKHVPVAGRLFASAPTAAERRALLQPSVADGPRPMQDGLVRDIPNPPLVGVMIEPRGRHGLRAIGPSVAQSDSGTGVEILTAVVVDHADRVRVHLVDLRLPPAAAIWSWGDDGIRQGPLRLDRVDSADGVWSPSARGPQVTVGVQIPSGTAAGPYSFRVDRVAEILVDGYDTAVSATGPCLEDYACYDHPSVVVMAASAVGRMTFINGGVSYVCTGALLADKDDIVSHSVVPYC